MIDSNDESIINFLNESKENLSIAENYLLELEKNSSDEILNALFRTIHSVKGAAGFLKFSAIEKLAHCAETLMGQIREGKKKVTAFTVTLLLESVDLLQKMVNDCNFGEKISTVTIIEKYDRINKAEDDIVGNENWVIIENKRIEKKFLATCFNGIDSTSSSNYYCIFITPSYLSENALQIKKLKSLLFNALDGIGKILSVNVDLDEIEQCSDDIVIVFETVLEPDLFFKVVPIASEDIIKLSANSIKQIQCQSSPIQYQLLIQDVSEKIEPEIKLDPALEKTVASKDHNGHQGQSIRIGVEVLDKLLDLIGEVVLGRNQFVNRYGNEKSFFSLSQSITKLHQYVIQTRMQPIGTLFQRYSRTVRDLSQQLNKKIDLHIEGGEIGLDRTVLEALADPLVHLVRNAIDHGIEDIEQRSKSGKSVVGNIFLRALHESGQILIEVEDDGKGIDPELLRKKIVEKSLLELQDVAALTDKEVVEYVFSPGFSTKDTATEISGRGVGMDVVKSNLESIGCTVEIVSRKNRGTIVSARIPLTMAIVNSSVISALIISIDKFTLAIPQLAVNEIIRLSPQEYESRVDNIKGTMVFKLRDKIIPLVHLEHLLDVEQKINDSRTVTNKNNEYNLDKNSSISNIFIVLQFKQNFFCILVDRIQGTEEIVVKRLPLLLKNRSVFAGATILGNGKVSLILDINGMVEKANLDFYKKQETQFLFSKKTIKEDQQKIVIFNNAENEYFAIPVNLLSEVDHFTNSEIHTSGSREFIKRHGESIPLLRLEKYLDVKPVPQKKSYIVLIPSRVSYPTGIIANRIVTTTLLSDTINIKEANCKGLMGTIFHENKLIMLLDIYSLLHHSDPDKHKGVMEINLEECRLLLVEDQLFFRQLVSQYFRAYGVKHIVTAVNGQEALDILYKAPDAIDVVISDIEMPVMDGFQLVASIKSSPILKAKPVMALTTLAGQENIQKGIDAGFDSYEIKIDKEHVLNSLIKLYQTVLAKAG